jgi:tRNA(fMet)-specific endonuclease VapC
LKYLLDTDHITLLQRNLGSDSEILKRRIDATPDAEFAFSMVSFHEQVLGAHTYVINARSETALLWGYELFDQILTAFSASLVLPFDARANDLFEQLRARKIRISTMDLRIACIAIVNDRILLTRNFRDFEKVPELRLEDWTQDIGI